MSMIKLVFVACSLISPPGAKAPCKEVSLTMIPTQAYGVIGAPQYNSTGVDAKYKPGPRIGLPHSGVTAYFEGEQFNAVNCQRNGEFEIAKWAIQQDGRFSIKRGFRCVPENEMAKVDL